MGWVSAITALDATPKAGQIAIVARRTPGASWSPGEVVSGVRMSLLTIILILLILGAFGGGGFYGGGAYRGPGFGLGGLLVVVLVVLALTGRL